MSSARESGAVIPKSYPGHLRVAAASENVYGEPAAIGVAVCRYVTFVYQYAGSKTKRRVTVEAQNNRFVMHLPHGAFSDTSSHRMQDQLGALKDDKKYLRCFAASV